jgi:hypothetical protein
MYTSYDTTIFDKYQIFNFYNIFEFQTKKILPILNIISDIASRLSQSRDIVKFPARLRYEQEDMKYLINHIKLLYEHLNELNLKMSNISVDKLIHILNSKKDFAVNESEIALINEIQARVIDELSLKKIICFR